MSLDADNAPAILKLPPELFPLVASHLPLQLLPATLSALASTSRDIYSYLHPVLYARVIIKHEDHASQVLKRISKTEPTLGLLIRELHIRLDLAEVHNKRNRRTVVVKLQEAIENGLLPHMKYLRLVLRKLKSINKEDNRYLNAQYHLPRRFWPSLRRSCPMLQGLCVDGFGDSSEDPWTDEPDFYDLKDFLGLQTLSLRIGDEFPKKECSVKLAKNVANLSSSLQSLTLFFQKNLQDPGSLLSITLPHLRILNIFHVELDRASTEKAMIFWARHPNLERVSIHTKYDSRWFSDSAESLFLPKLTYLTANYENVRALATQLGQLRHLRVNFSYNFQIPYLLRSVLPDGLPNLRSLEIHLVPCMQSLTRSIEGGMWNETEEGDFLSEAYPIEAYERIDSSYMISIVRGAPNLEELCLQGFPLFMKDLKQISPILGRLRFLERFFYRAFPYDKRSIKPRDVDGFMSKCRLLGESCRSLRTVTDVRFYKYGPYLVGTIVRGFGGSVEDVVRGRGFGMEFTGGHDDPFPLNLLY